MVEGQTNYRGPGNQAAFGPDTNASGQTPALLAVPATSANVPANAPVGSGGILNRKFYTITAELRETYDDNVNTSASGGKVSALETSLSPSVLVTFPIGDNNLTARYTFNLTYYSAGGGGSNSSSPSVQYTHEFDGQYTHTFSERFTVSAADDFRYYTEPNIFQSTGTNYSNGAYVSNLLSLSGTAQWTPIFSTSSSYNNTVVHYNNSIIGQLQDSVENTGTQSFNFAILPKISLNVGGTVDDIDYSHSDRGYISYTGFVGAQWQSLPSLTFSGRLGASYTQVAQSSQSAQLAPYGDLSMTWKLGARSSLDFDYAHEVTPTDQIGANGQNSDRFTANFSYEITPRVSTHLQGTFTIADISSGLSVGGSSATSYSEDDYGIDSGVTFQYNNYLNFDGGVTITGVSSDNSLNAYNRDQVYLGVRGTY